MVGASPISVAAADSVTDDEKNLFANLGDLRKDLRKLVWIIAIKINYYNSIRDHFISFTSKVTFSITLSVYNSMIHSMIVTRGLITALDSAWTRILCIHETVLFCLIESS